MATLVFDIETSAIPIESFDDSTQEYLMGPANKLPTEQEQDKKETEDKINEKKEIIRMNALKTADISNYNPI